MFLQAFEQAHHLNVIDSVGRCGGASGGKWTADG